MTQLFAKVSEKLRSGSNNEHLNSLLLFIAVGAGSGKIFTLKILVKQIRRLSTNRFCIAITAPTGVAARLIKGCTLHSTFISLIEKVRQYL